MLNLFFKYDAIIFLVVYFLLFNILFLIIYISFLCGHIYYSLWLLLLLLFPVHARMKYIHYIHFKLFLLLFYIIHTHTHTHTHNILICPKFILKYSLRYGSNHILLPDSLQLTEQFLMNNIYFSPLIQYENFRESISH